MSDLKKREEKIKEKRKQTTFRDFLKEIGSWQIMNIYRNNNKISRFPISGREPKSVDPRDFGNNIKIGEISEDFFDSFSKLYKKQEQMRLMQRFENENCEYAEVYGGKNCYLSFSVGLSAENIFYSFIGADNVRNIYNSIYFYNNCDNIYQSRIVKNSYNIFYSSSIYDSNNIWFSSNIIGCYECINCNDISNQSYCIDNIQYPKEEYNQKKKMIMQNKLEFTNIFLKTIKNSIYNKLCTNCTGVGLFGCSNVHEGYLGLKVSDGKNFVIAGGQEGSSNFYDCFDVGFQLKNNDLYGVHYCGEGSSNIYCSSSISGSINIFYSYFLENCSYCLGCIGLKNKSFYILNKEYSKEERYKLADKIFAQMDKDGTLGEFFPGSMNPFYFNDTAAYLIDDTFTKEEVIKEGYLRRDEEIKVDIPQGADVVETKDLSSRQGFNDKGEWKINPEILKKVIKDSKGNFYRIVPMELDFLQKYSLPLPEIHRLERIKLGFKFK